MLPTVLEFITGPTYAALLHVLTAAVAIGSLAFALWLRGTDDDGHPRAPHRRGHLVLYYIAATFGLASFAGWATQVRPILGSFEAGGTEYTWALVLFRVAFFGIYTSILTLVYRMARSMAHQVDQERIHRRQLAAAQRRLAAQPPPPAETSDDG